MPFAADLPRALRSLAGILLFGGAAQAVGCSSGTSDTGTASSSPAGGNSSTGAGGSAAGTTTASGGASGQAGSGVAGSGLAGTAGTAGADAAGGASTGAGGTGSGAFCQPTAPTSFDVPAGAACASRPLTDLSTCEAGSSLEECLSLAIVSCGPKCGCSCVALHFDDGGCVTTVESSEPAMSQNLTCLLSQLAMARFGPGAAAVVMARLGACNVC